MIEIKDVCYALIRKLPEIQRKFPKLMEGICITPTKEFFSDISAYTKNFIALSTSSTIINRAASYMFVQNCEYYTEIRSMTECELIEWFVDRALKYDRDKGGYKVIKYLENDFQYWDNFLTIYYR